MGTVAIYLPEAQERELRSLASLLGKPLAAVMQEALENYSASVRERLRR